MRTTATGMQILNFSVASQVRFPKGSPTIFMNWSLFGKQAAALQQYLKKGTKVFCQGRLQLNQWKATDGTDKSALQGVCERIELLGGTERSNQPPAEAPHQDGYLGASPRNQPPPRQAAPPPQQDADDQPPDMSDIPF